MDAATAGLIGAFGGALIGLAGTWLFDHLQSGRALHRERRRAFGSFLGALYPTVGELREMPANREGGLFDKLDSVLLTEQAAWIQSRRGLARTSPHLFSRIDRLLASVALLQVMDIPPAARTVVDEAIDYVERLGQHRSSKVRDEWPSIHANLLNAAESL